MMKMKHTRHELRDEDFKKVIDGACSDYKYLYEDTLRRLIIGKACADEYDSCIGAVADAAQFYVDLLMPDDEESLSGRYVKGIR